MDAPPLLFDRRLHRLRLDRAASAYAEAGFLKARAAEDAVERLEVIKRDFGLAVDIGARDGAFARALAQSPAAAKVGLLVEADLSPRMLAGRPGPRLIADEERLPFAPERFDLVVSLLSLHWTNDLPGALVQIRRALKPDGLFLGALIGGSSLTELRQALLQAETEIQGGAGPRVSPFADALDGASLLQRAGFALPVSDLDRVTVAYRDLAGLIADLRRMGETNVLADRPRRPLTREVLARASAIYAERFVRPDGKLIATFDLVTLTGWAPHPDQPTAKPGPRRRIG
jgi:SAM-dependent methyltransferase